MSEDYAKVDAYLNGYRAAINAAFCPETGWFWKTLSDTHGDVVCKLSEALVVDSFYDAIVEAVNEELGR